MTGHSRANALETDPVVEDVQLKIGHQAQGLSTKNKPMEKHSPFPLHVKG